MAEKFAGFSPELFAFLDELKHNNDRDWFNDNKDRYEEWVREPSLAFVRAMGPRLKKLSAHFVADDRRSGGSLMRIYRDTRFGKDKTPYKTNVGIQFRHEMGKDVHAPGFYVHLASEECFLGVGVWCPESSSLRRIRDTIVDDPALWKRTRDNKKFNSHFFLGGDSLKTAPRGFAKDHPLIDDLRR
ncbi:MAG: TIGR02453 family protein, partial [Pirellulaceae bacterium]|nr:TIGR02453 family protein [Pirellulaceae bacterium]